MGYVGNQTTTAYTSMTKQVLTGVTGSPVKRGFTLTHAVANAQEIEVFVNNVRQEPTEAYTVGTVTPPDGSVGTAKIADGAVSTAKIASSAVDLTSKVTGVLPVANGGNGLLEYSRGSKSTQTTINSTTPLDVGVRAKLNPTNNAQVIRVNWQWSYHDATVNTAQRHELEYRLGTGSWTPLVIWGDYVVHINIATNQYSTANLAWYGLASTLSATNQVLEFRCRVAIQGSSSWNLNDPLGGNAWSAGQLTFIEAHLYDGGIYTAGTDVT